MSERSHPTMQEVDRVDVERDMFAWKLGDPDALYGHLEDVLYDLSMGDRNSLARAALRVKFLMCACTVEAEARLS